MQAVVKVSSMGSVVRVARWLEENMELVVGDRLKSDDSFIKQNPLGGTV